MARLTADQRKAMPRGEFALPGGRFPIEDKNHAEAALIDVGRAKGLSPSQKATVKRKARAELGETKEEAPKRRFGQMSK